MNTLKPIPAAGNRNSPVRFSPSQLQERLERGEKLNLLDVREAPEFAAGRLPGSQWIPLGELERRSAEIPADQTVVCLCRSGKRAGQAAEKLMTLGRSNVALLEGGVLAWEQAGLPLEKDARAPWALDRQVRLISGLLVLSSLGVSLAWPPAIGLAWFVGAGMVFAAVTDWCGMALLLAKAPWNRRAEAPSDKHWRA